MRKGDIVEIQAGFGEWHSRTFAMRGNFAASEKRSVEELIDAYDGVQGKVMYAGTTFVIVEVSGQPTIAMPNRFAALVTSAVRTRKLTAANSAVLRNIKTKFNARIYKNALEAANYKGIGAAIDEVLRHVMSDFWLQTVIELYKGE